MVTFMYRLPSWLMGGVECELHGADADYEYISIAGPTDNRIQLRIPVDTVIKTKLIPDEPPPGHYLCKSRNMVLINDRGSWSQLGWSNQQVNWETAFEHWCNGEVPAQLIELPAIKAPWASPGGAYPTSITVDPSTGMIHVTVARRDHVVNPMKAMDFALALLAIASKVVADETGSR